MAGCTPQRPKTEAGNANIRRFSLAYPKLSAVLPVVPQTICSSSSRTPFRNCFASFVPSTRFCFRCTLHPAPSGGQPLDSLWAILGQSLNGSLGPRAPTAQLVRGDPENVQWVPQRAEERCHQTRGGGALQCGEGIHGLSGALRTPRSSFLLPPSPAPALGLWSGNLLTA